MDARGYTGNERRRQPKPLDRARLDELALAYVARFATSAGKLERYLLRKIRERGWEGDSPADPAAIVAPLKGKLLSVSVVPAPGHDAHSPADIAAHADRPVTAFPDVAAALRALPGAGDVLIAGSLYLAGAVLRLNAEFPD